MAGSNLSLNISIGKFGSICLHWVLISNDKCYFCVWWSISVGLTFQLLETYVKIFSMQLDDTQIDFYSLNDVPHLNIGNVNYGKK